MTPIFLPQPLPPNQPSYFPPPLIPPKPKPSNSSPNGPPPVIRPRNDSLFPKTTTTTSNYNAQNHPQQQYSNTSITPPIIPLRPYPGTTSTNTNGTQSYYSRSYSSQASYQFGFGRQSGFGSTSTNSSSSTQSNTATNQWNTLPPKSVTTYSQSQQYITSNSAPTTPTIPPNTPNSNPPTTKTEPVRKGVGQFNVSVNKAMDGIDRIITKASNALSSPRNKNTTPNQNQPQQNTAAVKTN
uniref:Uncharacterized protein n=1 Tax=Panagrolaimus superbus TaxID=310955 RepID=A0A914Y315_9BILA